MKYREIKFRAFTKLGMIEDVVVSYPFTDNEYGFHIHIEAFEEQKPLPDDRHWEDEELEKYDLYSGYDSVCGEGPIMQYTGLKDIKGKEIYEGDIMKSHDEYLVVYYNSATGSYDLMFAGGDSEPLVHDDGSLNAEVVAGNIYENPELVKDHEAIRLQSSDEEVE